MILENANSEVLLESCYKTGQKKKKRERERENTRPSSQHQRAKVTVLLRGNRKRIFKVFLPCMSTSQQNSFIVTEKSNPKRTIERKIASLIFLESHDVEGTLFVESLVCLGGRGEKRGGEMVKGVGWMEKGGDGESPEREREREGGKKENMQEREKPRLRIFCIPWVVKQKSPRKGKKKKNCGKLTQSRIMAKSIKFDQVSYNEVRLRIPSRDNEDRSQALEMHCSLCAWNMQQPAGSHQIITQYLCGSRKLPAQVECLCYIKRQHSEMFLMNIFVRERKGI